MRDPLDVPAAEVRDIWYRPLSIIDREPLFHIQGFGPLEWRSPPCRGYSTAKKPDPSGRGSR